MVALFLVQYIYPGVHSTVATSFGTVLTEMCSECALSPCALVHFVRRRVQIRAALPSCPYPPQRSIQCDSVSINAFLRYKIDTPFMKPSRHLWFPAKTKGPPLKLPLKHSTVLLRQLDRVLGPVSVRKPTKSR